MEYSTKTLRDYQEKLIFNVSRATGDLLVEQPTGSGKTVQIVTLVAMHLGSRFTHAVISAPQEQIEQGFVKRDYNLIDFPNRHGVAVPAIQVTKNLIMGSRESRVGSVKRIIQYIRQRAPLDHAFACTHAALNRLAPEDLPDDLTGKALFIDEAHHASADGLSQIVTLWRERGGQLYFFTATPYRGDGRPVKLDGMRTYRRSLAEHMAEGFAPRHLESEIVALGNPGDAITAGQFTGEEAPPSNYFESLIEAICQRWMEDGKPKAIVRVPPMRGGKSGELVTRLMQGLVANGARVLDATGTGAADKQRFLAGLEAEKSRTHATSAYDVMIGIQRVLEGTDWPVCSAVYCVGMPGSLNTVVQFLGRAMRLKGADYPADQRDRARLVFFVPCGGGSALEKLSIDHSRHALLTCCFLADHEVGQEWIVTQEVRRGIEAAFPPSPGTPGEGPGVRVSDNAADAENEADEPLDPEIRAEVELAIASAREQIVSSGSEPTLGEVMALTAKTRPDLPATAVQRVATEILAAQTTPTGTAVRQVIQQEVAKRLRIDPKVKKAMTEAFAVVLEEFRDATLKDSAVLESVGRQVHGVTGGQMREFAQRLRDAAPRPLTVEQILAWADEHHGKNDRWPTVNSGLVEGACGDTWERIDENLRVGHRGLPGGSSLANLLGEARGLRHNFNLPPLTELQILEWADAHMKKNGDWPRENSGVVEDAPEESWFNVSQSLRLGLRGLEVGSSLAKLLGDKRGAINNFNVPTLAEEEILRWVDEYFQRTGEWPKENSGPIPGTQGETWKRIKGALQKGIRGLSGNRSLAQLLAEERGARNHLELRPLSLDQILSWADAHYARTGKWPKGEKGPIADAPGESWTGVKVALVTGQRGLPGGNSLARLLAENRGVRNHLDLPALTVEQILAWADAHFQRTGKWPSETSGAIEDAPGEKWVNICQALRKGLRGFPRGSSFAKLLTEHRGDRIANEPHPRSES